MLHSIVMAGGFGTRFWPASRARLPKQLLKLGEDRTLLQAAVGRMGPLVPPERTVIVTNATLVEAVAAQLPLLPREAILGEPCKRDTAACIGWAAALIAKRDSAATLVVMPSDHVIEPDEDFQLAVQHGAELVEREPQKIVTFGIRPSYPAETFGYIERGEPIVSANAPRGERCATYRVVRFREKPPAAVAREYLAAGRFYWNSGIFIWKAKTILEALATHEPELAERLGTIASAVGKPNYEAVLAREFAAIQGRSIDYAVMEHWHDLAVIEAPFHWDDVGSWQALARLHGQDEHGNTVVGRHLGLDTTGSIIRGEGEHLIVTLGLKDCLIVHTPDATLVADKHDEEGIRQVVRRLEELGWREYL